MGRLHSLQCSGRFKVDAHWTVPANRSTAPDLSAFTIHASAFFSGIGYGASKPTRPAGSNPNLGE